jgi:rod shape-determining protein MreC
MLNRAKTALVAFGAVLALAILHFTGLILPIENGLRYAFSPVGYFFSSLGTGLKSKTQDYKSLTECQEHSSDVERRLGTVSVDYVRLKALEEENAVLRTMLGYLQKKDFDSVMARVISRSAAPEKSVVMIDRGSKDGLEIGLAVIVGEGIYVGKVTGIQEHTAAVTLIPDPTSRVAISLTGQHKLIGLLEGKGNGTAVATLIPQEEQIKENDILVTAGTDEKIPGDLAIGMVNRIIGQPIDPFKSASIEPLVSLDFVEMVAILKPKTNK